MHQKTQRQTREMAAQRSWHSRISTVVAAGVVVSISIAAGCAAPRHAVDIATPPRETVAPTTAPLITQVPPLGSDLTPGNTSRVGDRLLPPPSGSAAGMAGRPGAGLQVDVTAALVQKVKDHPGDETARLALAAQLDRIGKSGNAEDVLRAGLARGDRSPRLYHALGMLYMNHRLYDGAAEEFLCEVQRAPKDADANLRLAECYSLIGQRDRAQKYFEAAAKLRPSDPDIYIGLAYLNSSNQRSPFAIRYLQKYIQLAPNPGQGYLLLSRIFVNQNRFTEAIDAGQKGIAVLPSNADMWYNLGQAYAYSHDDRLIGKAQEAFQRVLQLDPNSGHGHYEMGRIYARTGRIDEAVAQYAEAVRCEPLSGRYHYQYGRALAQAHKQTDAARELARSKVLLPLNQREDHLRDRVATVQTDAKAWTELGSIYRQYGELEKAQSCVTKALSLSPGLPAARALQQELASAAPVAGPAIKQ